MDLSSLYKGCEICPQLIPWGLTQSLWSKYDFEMFLRHLWDVMTVGTKISDCSEFSRKQKKSTLMKLGLCEEKIVSKKMVVLFLKH